jgi:tRNA modification GTPase
MYLQETIVALATAPGTSAIAVVRLSGDHAISIADKAFFGKKLAKQRSHTIHFGSIRDESGKVIDEVLLSLFIAPKSYTKENIVEISCHGSPYIQQQIIQLLVRLGARMAKPGEFTLRAFLNGGLDLSQAEAVADLIASSSESSHTLAMQQMRGGISNEIKKLREELIHFASLIELELDFGEEDVVFADRTQLSALISKIQQYIGALLQSFQLGNALKNGIATVIAGRPNAGKSTILNALLNEDRAIVSEIAGTTRDTIEENLNINGVNFRLTDTAGIREAMDTIEQIGVAKTMEKIEQSSLLVYVFDVTDVKIDEVLSDIKTLHRDDAQLLIVCNKMDKNPYFDPKWLVHPNDESIPPFFFRQPDKAPFLSILSSENIITLAAKYGMNIPHLKEKLYDIAIGNNLNAESTIVSNARHYEALQHTRESLNAALFGIQNGITNDFVAIDIRRALAFLGEITGTIYTDDLLENIFRNFCIGK